MRQEFIHLIAAFCVLIVGIGTAGTAIMLTWLIGSYLYRVVCPNAYARASMREIVPDCTYGFSIGCLDDIAGPHDNHIPPDTRCEVIAGEYVGTTIITCWVAKGVVETYFVERRGGEMWGYEERGNLMPLTMILETD